MKVWMRFVHTLVICMVLSLVAALLYPPGVSTLTCVLVGFFVIGPAASIIDRWIFGPLFPKVEDAQSESDSDSH